MILDFKLVAIIQRTVGCLLLERRCVWITYSCSGAGDSSLRKCQDEEKDVYRCWAVRKRAYTGVYSVRMRKRVYTGIVSLSRISVPLLIKRNLEISGRQDHNSESKDKKGWIFLLPNSLTAESQAHYPSSGNQMPPFA